MDRVNYEISTQMARILKNTILKTTIDPMLDEANEYDGLERFLIDRTPIPYRKNWRNKKSSTLFKGQLISKCPFGIIVWTKYQRNYFCPEIFCTFLGASWKLFGASCRLTCLWNYILSPQEAQKASRKPPGSYKKNSGQKSRNNFVGILSKQ